MRHGRTDYDRIQDPAANRELLTAYNAAMDTIARGPNGSGTRAARHDEEPGSVWAVLSRLARALTPTLSPLIQPRGVSFNLPAYPIADDEPVFILRAQDVSAPGAVEHWCDMTEHRAKGHADVLAGVRAARAHADNMRVWQTMPANRARVKVADTPPELVDPAIAAALSTPLPPHEPPSLEQFNAAQSAGTTVGHEWPRTKRGDVGTSEGPVSDTGAGGEHMGAPSAGYRKAPPPTTGDQLGGEFGVGPNDAPTR